MVDVNVEFTLGNENPINAEFTLEPDVTYLANIVTATFSGEHNQLIHRDYPDQHPIEAITGLNEGLNSLSSTIDNETARAENAENILNGKIDDEVSRAILAEGNLSDRITSEVNRATDKENQLADDILAENNRAISAEETLQDNIDAEKTRAKDAEQSLADDISEEVNNRTSEITRVEGLISDEETRAKSVEQGLRADLAAETNRATNSEGVLQTNITAEENRAKGVEQQLASSIDSNHQAISNHVSDKDNPHEVTKAQVGLGNVENLAPADMPMSTATKTYIDNADNGLQGQITAINTTIGGYGNIVTHNVSEFATASQGALADTSLQPNDNISELTNNLNYQTATQVANSIAVETGNRESADNNLQSQIDAIVSASDVFDIVGTYAELQAYDISTVPVNDIIKVLEDSTHGGAATYYRCVETGGTKSWSYIGSEGASYTKAEADNKFVPQTRTVNGKALSNDITLTATDVGALPNSTVIPTVNNATVTIQKNGSTVSTFTLNQSSNETVNISVPEKTSDITNDSGYITGISSSDVTTALGYTPADDSDVVKTSGNQTVGGTKTFSSYIKATSQIDETSTSSQERSYIELSDNQATTGYIRQYWSTTQNQLRIRTLARHGEAAGSWGDIQQIIDANGNYRVNIDCAGTLTNMALKNHTASLNATDVPTKGWVNNPDTSLNVVHRTGNETISGIKTFNGVDVKYKRGGSDLTTQATSYENWVGPRFVDKNDVQGAMVQYKRLSTGVAETNIQTRALSTNSFSKIAIYQNPDETAYTEAPTPTEDTTSSTQIDTVGARNTKLQNYALSSSLATVATSGSYNDLSDKPTIPTVNNATLTIQKNGTTVKTFTANASTNVTANITVPTKTSELNNDSNFATVSQIPTDYVDLTGNQTINGIKTVNGKIVGDNSIEWGGTNLQQNVSPADAGCLDDFGHNKAAYWGGLIDAEYTVDGETWIDYGLSSSQKWALTTAGGTDVLVGKNTKKASDGTLTSDNIANVRARITLHIKDAKGKSRFYSALRKIVLNVSSNGASNCKVKVLTRTIENYTTGTDTWVDRGTYEVSGWAGWNSIPFINNLGGYDNQTGYNADLRLEFWSETIGTATSCLSIKDIRLIGVTNWVVDDFAKTGHLYKIDSAKNATFPARINFGTPTEDTTTSTQGDTVGARNTKLRNYALSSDVVATINTLLSSVYPVGSIYLTTDSTCPLATLISGSTWDLVGSGRVLQGADSSHAAGSTIEAGLPNITGSIKDIASQAKDVSMSCSGAFSADISGTASSYGTQKSGGYDKADFDASRSNSIYGNSTTVQPPAYVVNIFKRTA